MMRFAIVRDATAYYNQAVFVTRRSEEAPRRVSRLMKLLRVPWCVAQLDQAVVGSADK